MPIKVQNHGTLKLKKEIRKRPLRKHEKIPNQPKRNRVKRTTAKSHPSNIKRTSRRKQAIELGALGFLTLILLSTVPLGLTITNPSQIIVDDVDAQFVGNWGSSSYIPGFYGNVYRYHYPDSGYGYAAWTFDLPLSGSWEVFAIWTSYPNRATDAPYTINHADGSTTIRVNQELNGGEWISLGVYNFNAGTASVVLSDDANGVVIADAIKLVSSGFVPELPPAPTYVTLSYSSTPIAIAATIDSNTISSGQTTQVVVGSTVTIQAGQTQGYDFTHWLINSAEHTQNPLSIEVTADLTATAVYTTQPPPPTTSNMVVGVNMWSGTSTTMLRARDIPLLKQAGIEHVRIGTGVRDSFVDTALAEGISVIGTFGTNGLPDLNAFGNYIYNSVSHFKGRVNAWVVFNEANYFEFRGDPQGYTQALKVAYTRAKQADPNVKIVTTNILSVEDGVKFLEDMYQSGAKGYFDVLGIDPYCYPVSPTEPNADRWGHTFWRIPQFHNLMVQYGDGNKPVWIVEFGYRTPGGSYYEGDGKTVSEAKQAEYIVQALELAQTWPWLERFYIYEWMDSADPYHGNWGLIRESYRSPYQVKSAYYAVRTFISSTN